MRLSIFADAALARRAEVPSVNSAEFIKFSECFTDFQLEKQLSLELSWKRAGNELETSWKRAGKESQACRKLVRSGVPQRPNLAGTGLQPGPASVHLMSHKCTG